MSLITVSEVCADFPETNYFVDEDGHIILGLPIPERKDLTFRYDTETGEIFFDYPLSDYLEAWEDLITEMERKYGAGQKAEATGPKYRTRKQAAADVIPTTLAMPSKPSFQTALSLVPGDAAHMILFKRNIELAFEGNIWYFNGVEETKINVDDLRDPERTDIDLWTLRMLYTIISDKLFNALRVQTVRVEDLNNFSVTVYVPDLIRKMGLNGNPSKKNIDALVRKVQSGYTNVIGILPVQKDKTYRDKYAVISWHNYRESDNTITFSSPYMNQLIYRIMQSSIRRNNKGEIQTAKDGKTPLMTVNHSYLVKSSISKEKNVRAAENVNIICLLIEQAGKNVPRIKAKTIIERNPALEQALNSKIDASNQNALLKSTFTKTWELLRTQTNLTEVYPNIKIPESWPTMGTLDMVFEFPHSGKRRRKDI